MTLVWTRVDQKLIHGQISVAWVPYLSVDAVIVVDSDILSDVWAQKVMRMGLPPEISTAAFSSPADLPALLSEAEYCKRRVLVIFKNIEGVLEAVSAGFSLDTLNLGNHACYCPDKDVRLADTFFVNPDVLEKLVNCQKDGLKVILQALPTSKAVVLNSECILTRR